MVYLASVLFFSALLIALAVVLEAIVRANWVEIVAALKGVPPEQLRAPSAPVTVKRAGQRAAA